MDKIQTHALSRRSFLVASGAVGVAVTFGSFDDVQSADAAGPFQPNAWVTIDSDGAVTIMSRHADHCRQPSDVGLLREAPHCWRVGTQDFARQRGGYAQGSGG